MLQKLNERIQGVLAWIVIILIAVTFTLFGVDYYLQSKQSSDVEVSVNDEPITKQAYEINYRRVRQQYDPARLTAVLDNTLKKQVLDNMINNLISVQAAKAAGFTVYNSQADSAILGIPQFQQDGQFSSEKYKQALSNAMFTSDSFRKEVRQGMLLNQQKFAFIGSAFVIPEEIRRFVRLFMQTRNYQYILIPQSNFIDKNSIKEEQIESYYQQHEKDFVAPEQVSIEYVTLSMDGIRNQIKISDADALRYYNENQSAFQTPARWQVAHILFAFPSDADADAIKAVRIKADEVYSELKDKPDQFSKWVAAASSDKLSALHEGVLPWISAGETEFDPALTSLKTVNDISEPYKTSKGYEIFQLKAYQAAKIQAFKKVKSEIIRQLKTEIAQTRYAQLLEQLTDLSYQTPDSLQPVAEQLKLNINQAGPFSRAGGETPVTANKQLVSMAFTHDVMDLGNNSEPVQLDNESVVVLRVSQHIPHKQKSLQEVKSEIIDILAREQASNKAELIGQQLLSTQSADKFKDLMDEHHFSWISVKDASREYDKVDAQINELAFSLPKSEAQTGHILTSGDYVIVRLKEITEGNYDKLDKEQQTSIAQQMESNYGIMDYDIYINSQVRKAKIKD